MYRTSFFVISLAILSLGACASTRKPPPNPMAHKGTLDLSSWNFAEYGPVRLDGEWEFYWNQLRSPDSLAASQPSTNAHYISLPNTWIGYQLDGKALPGHGFATFRLQVNLRDPLPIGFNLGSMGSAYHLWVNGESVASNGKVGTSQEEMRPQFRPQVAFIPLRATKLDIVLQISNFHDRHGGMWEPLLIGPANEIYTHHNRAVLFEVILIGISLIMGLYHLILFSLRRRDTSSLLFGLLCLDVCLRAALMNERPLIGAFPDFNWSIAYTLEYLTVILGTIIVLMFTRALFPEEMPRLAVRLTQVVFGCLAIFVIATPPRIFTEALIAIQLPMLLSMLMIFISLGRAVKHHREGSVLATAGVAIFLGTIVIDVLSSNFIFNMPYFAPMGMTLLILSQASILAIRFSNAFTRVEHLSTDLEKKNIQLQELDKLKDEFLANTSHELRTPLNGIIGMSEALIQGGRGALNKEVVRDLSLIALSGRRLTSLVNDILDFSKLKHHDLELSLKAIDLHSMVNLVLALSKPTVGKKELLLQNKMPEDLPAVLADENRLHQILQNLLGNAVKFTERGQVTVGAEQQGEEIRIFVSDTGIGIDQAHQARIFEQFEQVDGATARAFGGTGLGLSVTKQLVELHGGRIWCDSTLGRGSTFSFTLKIAPEDSDLAEDSTDGNLLRSSFQTGETKADPAALPKGAAPGTQSHKPTIGAHERQLPQVALPDVRTTDAHPEDHGQGLTQKSETETGDTTATLKPDHPTVLVVDDEMINLEVVTSHLHLHGIQVLQASSGKEALAIFGKTPKIDLVLLDVMMPHMTGLEVCNRLRQRHSESELPVILLTAKNQVADLIAGFTSGANDYLVKPFSSHELLARIQNHIKVKNLTHEIISQKEAQARLEKDLDAARAVQETLFVPSSEIPEVETVVYYQSADKTGGDWFGSFYDQNRRRMIITLGDVTGHGFSSALVTGVTCGAMRGRFHALLTDSPQDTEEMLFNTVKILNGVVRETGYREKKTITMAFLVFDLQTEEVIYLNAGHNPIYFIQEKKLKPLLVPSNAIGMAEEPTFSPIKLKVQPGDRFFLYTDGLTENKGPDGTFLKSRVLEKVLKNGPADSRELTDAVLQKGKSIWNDQPPDDDCTFMVVKYLGNGQPLSE